MELVLRDVPVVVAPGGAVGLGVVFFAHGAQKVLGWFGGPGLKGTIGQMQKGLGIPPAAT